MTFESNLRQPFSQTELQRILQLEGEIKFQHEKLGSLTEEVIVKGVQKMSELRLKASGTLQRGDVSSWINANTFIHEQSLSSWTDVLKLNSFFSSGTTRNQEIYTGHLQACPQSELEFALASFRENILPTSETHSPLVYAALCQYWLVSIHPFLDGNGRTSILLTDWLLNKNGYLPQSFSSKLDAIVMYIPGRAKKMTPGMSVVKILENVLRSYKCFDKS